MEYLGAPKNVYQHNIIYIVHYSHVHCIFPFTVQIPPIKLRLEDKSALKEENGIPNLAITTVGTTEDSFSATRESLEILEMVPLDSPSDDE